MRRIFQSSSHKQMLSETLPTLSRRTMLLGGVGSIALLMQACSGLPASEGIHRHSDNLNSREERRAAARAISPQAGGTPESIIEGFLRAGVDSSDNYGIAREYLTTEFAQRWNPLEWTRVYFETARITRGENDIYKVSVTQSGLVDDRGLTSTSFSTDTPNSEPETFEMVQENGEWRIKNCPSGLWLDTSEFYRSFKAYRLYYYDPSYTYAVPDLRWFAHRDEIFKTLAQTLIAGPAKYLKESVFSATQESMKINEVNFNAEKHTIKIDFGGESIGELQLARLRQQIVHLVSNFRDVETVVFCYNGHEISSSDKPEGFHEISLVTQPNTKVVALNEDRLVTQRDFDAGDSQRTLVEKIKDPSAPTIGYDGTTYAYLSEGRKKLYTVRDTNSSKVWETRDLSRPSIDHYGWVWATDHSGTVRAFNPASDSVEEREKGLNISVPWRNGLVFNSLKISRDGTRGAFIASRDDTSMLIISGIIRDESGKPRSFTELVRVNASVSPHCVDWAGEQTLAVVNTTTGEAELTSLNSEETKLDRLEGLRSMSAAGDSGHIIGHVDTGECYLLEERGWKPISGTLSEITYAG